MRTNEQIIAALRERIQEPERRTGSGSTRLFPPADQATIDFAEEQIGATLHPLLRRMYAEVANGGFGPGFGLLGLAGGHRDEACESLVAVHRWPGWPPSLLPAWDWGCAIWSCIDMSSPDGLIVTHDSRFGATDTEFTIRSWMDAWLDGVHLWERIFDDSAAPSRVGINPFTKEPLVFSGHGKPIGKPRGRLE